MLTTAGEQSVAMANAYDAVSPISALLSNVFLLQNSIYF